MHVYGLFEEGVRLDVIQGLLGGASLAVSYRYLYHVAPRRAGRPDARPRLLERLALLITLAGWSLTDARGKARLARAGTA